MIRLRQIRAAEIPEKRPQIEEALRAVLSYSSGYSADWAFRKIESGVILLLEILQDGEEAGYVLTQLDDHSDVPVLYLWGVYGLNGGKLLYQGLLAALEELARRKGCSVIKAKSPRRGWERIAEAMGFEPTATEYERQVAT